MSDAPNPLSKIRMPRMLPNFLERTVAPVDDVTKCPHYVAQHIVGSGVRGLIGSRMESARCGNGLVFADSKRCNVDCPREDPAKRLTREIKAKSAEMKKKRSEISVLRKEKRALESRLNRVRKRR